MISILIALMASTSERVLAYPEMVRHGYPQCSSCHISPTGGGMLSPYGRTLSRELLSTAGGETETEYLYGLLHLPRWLDAGGDIRRGLIYRNNERYVSSQWIFMQGDFDFSAHSLEDTPSLRTYVSLGVQDPDLDPTGHQTLISREHWLSYVPISAENSSWMVRAGKFGHSYGLKIPEHFLSIRRGLGWDQGSETYNLETMYAAPGVAATVTAMLATPTSSGLETGATWNVGVPLGESYKLNAGHYYGQKDNVSRNVIGAWAQLGWTENIYSLVEFDVEGKSQGGGSAIWESADYEKCGYSLVQGLVPWISHGSKGDKNLWSLGLQWNPRPHLELNASFGKEKLDTYTTTGDFGYLVFHFYL